MSKKIWYSRPLADVWKNYQKANKNGDLTPKQFVKMWLAPILKNKTNNEYTVQSYLLVGDMFYADSEKLFLHLFFVDKALRDFLLDIPLADFDAVINFIKEHGEEIEQGGINRKGQTISTGIKTKSLCFGIHVPYEKEEKGYAFSFTVTPENKLILVWQANNSLGYITEDQYNLTEENQEDELSKQMFRLAVNTIVYMHTFPNCIVDGVPNITKEEKSFTVEIAEKVLSSDANTGKIVSPHFRKGYFKILRSDFYTHKKGQSVFVKETMVNGKAKTVYTADNLEEILDN